MEDGERERGSDDGRREREREGKRKGEKEIKIVCRRKKRHEGDS